MKFLKTVKWKSLAITCIVCLLAVVPGVLLWEKLPETLAIHFNFYNEPDNFAPKGFVVFGLPLIMVAFQIICCISSDINAKKYGTGKKVETVGKWVIPCMTLVLQAVTLAYGMGVNIDIRKAAMLIVGVMFIILGNYLPKMNYIKNYNLPTDKARKINRFVGFETFIMGIFAVATIFFPAVASNVWMILLIPYTFIAVIYGIVEGAKK